MLMLTRRIGERLIITAGDREIAISVVENKENQVTLGIVADKDVAVHREEVHRKLKQDGRGLKYQPASTRKYVPPSAPTTGIDTTVEQQQQQSVTTAQEHKV